MLYVATPMHHAEPSKAYRLRFAVDKGDGPIDWFDAPAALPWCCRLSGMAKFVQSALGCTSKDVVAVCNAVEMPLFQYMSQRARKAQAKYKEPVVLFADVELAEPVFSTWNHPTCDIPIVLKVLKKKPKQLPTMPRPLRVPPEPAVGDEHGCSIHFYMTASGAHLGSIRATLPWACRTEVLSFQLGKRMDLCFASLDEGKTYAHISRLQITPTNSNNNKVIDVHCVQQLFVNSVQYLPVTYRGEIPYECNGWRRHYKEFAALAEHLGRLESTPPKAIQLILQAVVRDYRVHLDGKAPRRHRKWTGCFHAMINSGIANNEAAAKQYKEQWCAVHLDILQQLFEIVASAPVGGTQFA